MVYILVHVLVYMLNRLNMLHQFSTNENVTGLYQLPGMINQLINVKSLSMIALHMPITHFSNGVGANGSQKSL